MALYLSKHPNSHWQPLPGAVELSVSTSFGVALNLCDPQASSVCFLVSVAAAVAVALQKPEQLEHYPEWRHCSPVSAAFNRADQFLKGDGRQQQQAVVTFLVMLLQQRACRCTDTVAVLSVRHHQSPNGRGHWFITNMYLLPGHY